MKRIHVKLLAVLAAVLVHGCCSERFSTVPMVTDVGPDVATKNRYRVSCVYSGIYAEETLKRIRFDDRFLERNYPHVFSAKGTPVVLRIIFNKLDSGNGWTEFLALCTIGVWPKMIQFSHSFRCSVEEADEGRGTSTFELVSTVDSAFSWSPTAFLFYNEEPHVDGRRVFYRHANRAGENATLYDSLECDPAKRMSNDVTFQKALAYALAVKLKELEDSGKIGVTPLPGAKQREMASAHRVVQLDRNPDKAYSYSFVIELEQATGNAADAVQGVLREFTASITDDYLDSHPGVDAKTLAVDFSNMKTEGARISGCAAVLTIRPVSLAYDANTRRGKLSVRFNPGQSEEARAWIRKNIETLVQDKNIALTTGQKPPVAAFTVLGEKVEGSVVEVEFKSE